MIQGSFHFIDNVVNNLFIVFFLFVIVFRVLSILLKCIEHEGINEHKKQRSNSFQTQLNGE